MVGTDHDIFVARSIDGGTVWSAPAALNGNAAVDQVTSTDTQPAVATDGTGTWVAVWTSSVAGGAGTWVAVWYSGVLAPGGDFDIAFARSTDGGLTWTSAAALNTNAAVDAGQDELPALAADDAGHWVAVWDGNETLLGEYDIRVARSADGGQTWTMPAPLNTNAATDAGLDLRPDVATLLLLLCAPSVRRRVPRAGRRMRRRGDLHRHGGELSCGRVPARGGSVSRGGRRVRRPRGMHRHDRELSRRSSVIAGLWRTAID